MSQPYVTTGIRELERADGWSPIRLHLGVQSFGINAWTAREAGGVLIPEHDEEPTRHEELYLVTAGHATFTVAGEQVDAPTGTIVFVPDPDAARGAVAAAPGTTVVSVGARPGHAFRPQPWETNRDIFALLESGRYEEARSVIGEALERYQDDHATLLYNLACADALMGDTDAAIEHLRAAVEDRPSLADAARSDADFQSIRADPRFTGIVDAS